MPFTPSIQQSAIFARVTASLTQSRKRSMIVEAVAGAGKTTTLVEVCKIIASAPGRVSAVFTAYNKAIADEIGNRLESAGISWKQVRSATFHSLGRSAWVKVAPSVRIDPDKSDRIMEALDVPEQYRSFVRKLVGHAKSGALGIIGSVEDVSRWFDIIDHHDLDEVLENVEAEDAVEVGIRHAQAVLRRSVEMAYDVIDYDDMLYMPVLKQVRMWQNDYVLVDEAQDTNLIRRLFAAKMLRPGGMLIAVGDRHQAIYGFTGADNDSLDQIAKHFDAEYLPLTVTYRCPQAVVDHARQWVNHITAHDSAPMGVVASMDFDQFSILPASEFTEQDAVLCRNTKPLVELAFALLRREIACHVEGREIGENLMKMARRWKKVTTIGALRTKLADHLEEQSERLLAKKQEAKLGQLTDQVETLLVLMEGLADDDSIDAIQAKIERIFRNSPPAAGITLSTIHKAKGREWNKVYLLGRNRYQPSPFARQDWQHEQEINLMYVAVTRAKQTLVEVVVPRPVKR